MTPLSALGYLFLPVFIALAVTDGVARFTRSQLRDKPVIEHDVYHFLDEAYAGWEAKEQEAAKEAKGAGQHDAG
jgi:hypothetical protein